MFPMTMLFSTLYAGNEKHSHNEHRPSYPILVGRCSVVVSIPPYHAADLGSIPDMGVVFRTAIL